jgi:hypothetical protein
VVIASVVVSRILFLLRKVRRRISVPERLGRRRRVQTSRRDECFLRHRQTSDKVRVGYRRLDSTVGEDEAFQERI